MTLRVYHNMPRPPSRAALTARKPRPSVAHPARRRRAPRPDERHLPNKWPWTLFHRVLAIYRGLAYKEGRLVLALQECPDPHQAATWANNTLVVVNTRKCGVPGSRQYAKPPSFATARWKSVQGAAGGPSGQARGRRYLPSRWRMAAMGCLVIMRGPA